MMHTAGEWKSRKTRCDFRNQADKSAVWCCIKLGCDSGEFMTCCWVKIICNTTAAIGFNFLDIKEIRVDNLIPAVFMPWLIMSIQGLF
jgi:hypothetical protein